MSKQSQIDEQSQNSITVCFRMHGSTPCQFKLVTYEDTDNLHNMIEHFRIELQKQLDIKFPQFIEYHLSPKIKTNLQRMIDPQQQLRSIFEKYGIKAKQLFIVLKEGTQKQQSKFQPQPSNSYEISKQKRQLLSNQSSNKKKSQDAQGKKISLSSQENQSNLDGPSLISFKGAKEKAQINKISNQYLKKEQSKNKQNKSKIQTSNLPYKVVITYQNLQRVFTLVIQKCAGSQMLLQLAEREIEKIQLIENKQFLYQINGRILRQQVLNSSLKQLDPSLKVVGQTEQTIYIKIRQKYQGG